MNFGRNHEERGFQNRNHALWAQGLQGLLSSSQPKQDLNWCSHSSGAFMLMLHPPFPRWIQKPKQMCRMSFNISSPKERHRNIPNEPVNTALKEPFHSVPPPITLSIRSCYGDDNYSWSAGYSNYCHRHYIKLVTTCVRQGLSLQLCTFPCPPPPFKVGCWRVFCCNCVVKDKKFNYFLLISTLQEMMAVASSCLDDPNQAVSDYFHNKGGKQDLRIHGEN